MSEQKGLVREKVKLVGMHCATCALTIERAIRGVKGIKSVQVSSATEEALIEYNPRVASLREIVKSVRSVGYDVAKKEAVLRVPSMVSVDDEGIIESRLRRAPGIIDAHASHLSKTVIVAYNPLTIEVDDILKMLEEAGYKASVGEFRGPTDESEAETRNLLKGAVLSIVISIVLASFLIADLMGLALPEAAVNYVSLALASIVVLGPGRRFYIGAYRALRNRTANMDTLVALGTASIYLFSSAVTLGLIGGDVYFEAATWIIAFVLLGRYIEARAKHKTGEAVKKLEELTPREALIVRGGREQRLPVSKVRVGDVVIVRQGERIPVDGIVVKGKAFVDESVFTGEPKPVEKKPRDPVLAGSHVVSGYLHVITTRTGSDTTIGQITRIVAQAQAGKLEIQRIVDRIAGAFTWIVMGIAALTFTYWYAVAGVGLELSILFAASVLLVACPCGLGLATPTAVVAGVGLAARRGLIIRNVKSLEILPKAGVVAFDKTGTLTEGRPTLVSVEAVNGFTPDEVLELAASAEKWSEHPLARAIVEGYKSRAGRMPRDPENFEPFTGMGVVARVDGHTVIVGNEKLMRGFEVEVDSRAREKSEESMRRGLTVVYVGVDSRLAGILAIGDKPREEAREAVEALRGMGLETIMLTGDKRTTAEAIAGELGIERVIAEVDPEAKAEVIKDLQRQGKVVVMVGDGVNDSPALSRADVGVAMGTGADISREAGDIILARPDLRRIPQAVRISRKVRRRIIFNLFWAFIYNVLLIPVAAGVLVVAGYGVMLRPELAAAAMALSSISVTTSSYLLAREKV